MFRLVAIPRGSAWMIALAASFSQATEIARIRDADRNVVAVGVSEAALLHTTQLMPREVATATENIRQQGEQVLARLAEVLAQSNAQRSDVVKLNVYVRDAATRALFSQQLAAWFGNDSPAIAFVASPLPNSAAAIGLDAVVATDPAKASRVVLDRVAKPGTGRAADVAVLPVGDVVYVSGQAESGELQEATRETMAGLIRTIEHLGLSKSDVVQVKCFLKPISQVAVADAEISRWFAGEFESQLTPPVVYVEWTSASRAIEIELIAAAGRQQSSETVSYLTPPWMKPSPVFSRAARIHGDERIYVAGLYPQDVGDGAAQVKSIFAQLTTALDASGTDLMHLAKATYYVSDEDASTQLNQLRPTYYDPSRPPAASKAAVQSIASEATGSGITIDIIAAPAKRTGGADAVRVIKDIAYLGADRRETMDVYLPPGQTPQPRPAVVIIHGGGWHGGDKASAREQNIADALAGAGYVCASINYELAKKSDHLGERLRSIWPRNLHDCKTAVRYLRAHAEDFQIDKQHIGAIGGSAGGHLVAILATTDVKDGFDDASLYTEQSSRIQAVVPMYGVHDVVAQARTRQNELTEADLQLCRSASPVTYVTPDDPPALILHGTKDALVPVEQSEILHQRLQAANLQSELVIIQDAPHSFHLQPKQRDLRELVIGFFDKHLKPAR